MGEGEAYEGLFFPLGFWTGRIGSRGPEAGAGPCAGLVSGVRVSGLGCLGNCHATVAFTTRSVQYTFAGGRA